MTNTMTNILDHRLDVLTLFGIDIKNCKDETDVAEKIYDYYVGKNQLEKLQVWAAGALADSFGDYRHKDFIDLAREGLSGINTWKKIDFVSHICTYIEGCGYQALESVLEGIKGS